MGLPVGVTIGFRFWVYIGSGDVGGLSCLNLPPVSREWSYGKEY